MMTLQLVSEDESLLLEIAEFLLKESLIANAMISETGTYKTLNKQNTIVTSNHYILKGISKSLLFSHINQLLRKKYKERLPLLYSEPIILIDPEQTEAIVSQLAKV